MYFHPTKKEVSMKYSSWISVCRSVTFFMSFRWQFMFKTKQKPMATFVNHPHWNLKSYSILQVFYRSLYKILKCITATKTTFLMWLEKSLLILSTTGSSISETKVVYACKISCEYPFLLLCKFISFGVVEGSSTVSVCNYIYFTLLYLFSNLSNLWETEQFGEASVLSSNTILVDVFALSIFLLPFFRGNNLLEWKLTGIKIRTLL